MKVRHFFINEKYNMAPIRTNEADVGFTKTNHCRSKVKKVTGFF